MKTCSSLIHRWHYTESTEVDQHVLTSSTVIQTVKLVFWDHIFPFCKIHRKQQILIIQENFWNCLNLSGKRSLKVWLLSLFKWKLKQTYLLNGGTLKNLQETTKIGRKLHFYWTDFDRWGSKRFCLDCLFLKLAPYQTFCYGPRITYLHERWCNSFILILKFT